MIRMARLASYTGLGLAISSFLGLMVRHIPPLGAGLWVGLLLLLGGLASSLLAGDLIDHHFGWTPDTAIAMSAGSLGLFVIGCLVGMLLL